jgi:hypothetical protein
MILPIVDVVTSVFAGCVVFVTLGFMAEEAGVSVDKVVDSGNMGVEECYYHNYIAIKL